jgi:protein TonB
MKSLLLTIFLFGGIAALSQTDTATYGYVHGTYIKVEILPTYPGGEMVWQRFLNRYLDYPDRAMNARISGTVTVEFTVDPEGRTSDFKVVKSVNPDLDEEALRLMKKSGRWFPAIQKGRKAGCRTRQDIEFKLNDTISEN